ncbi:MAG: formate dehydrogenase accessory protein FdhE [Syntrophaceae bacterium PtaU1.Bin231]|nr:MAG: formate dehydrogenase accessory protein FdhE [Syntrophaceae bacterium PtaU1.Bin231]
MRGMSERMLHKTMDEVLEKKPYCGSILNSFRPVLVARNRLIGELKLDRVEARPDDRERLNGIPLIRRQPLFFESDPWRSIACSLIPAMQEGFPDLGLELEKIKVDILGGRIRLFGYFRLFPDVREETVAEWAAQCGVRAETVQFLLLNIARIVLAIRAKNIAPILRGMRWDRGYCPVCGGLPMLSILRDKGRRWLHCSLCGSEWRFPRVVCPFCGHESPSGMNFFFLQDRQDESAFACEACKRYLISVSRSAELSDVDPDITAISLLHLDLMMQQRTFRPVAECGWNVL